MKTDDSDEVVERLCLGAERRGSGVFEEELFDTSADGFDCELSFVCFVAWSKENDVRVVGNSVFFAERSSDAFDSFLQVSGKVAFAGVEGGAVSGKKMSEMAAFGINVSDSFVNTVLTNILSRELVAITKALSQRNSVVREVNILFSPVSKVTHKSVEIVTLWHIDSTVLIILYTFSLSPYL